MTIRDAARRAGASPRAVRLYERIGILGPQPRTAAGYRLYTDADVRLLQFVRRARDLGLTLQEIRVVVDRHRSRGQTGMPAIELLGRLLDGVTRESRELDARRQALRATLHRARLLAADGHEVRLCEVTEDLPTESSR